MAVGMEPLRWWAVLARPFGTDTRAGLPARTLWQPFSLRGTDDFVVSLKGSDRGGQRFCAADQTSAGSKPREGGDFPVGVDNILHRPTAVFEQGFINVHIRVTAHGEIVHSDRPNEVLVATAGSRQDHLLVWRINNAGISIGAAA